MLKNQVADKDLTAVRSELREKIPENYAQYFLDSQPIMDFRYPQLQVPEKIKSLDLNKQAHIEGTLIGVKGQYMIFENGVINMRKYSGYKVRVVLGGKA